LKAAHDAITLVPHSGKGKNALDFHLSFYLGYVAARQPEARLVQQRLLSESQQWRSPFCPILALVH